MSFSRFSGFAENNDDICGSGPYKYRYLDKARNARNRAWTLGLCESVFFLFSRLNKRAVGFLMWSLWALFGAQCYSWWCQKGSIKKIKRFGKWTEFDSFILVTRKSNSTGGASYLSSDKYSCRPIIEHQKCNHIFVKAQLREQKILYTKYKVSKCKTPSL